MTIDGVSLTVSKVGGVARVKVLLESLFLGQEVAKAIGETLRPNAFNLEFARVAGGTRLEFLSGRDSISDILYDVGVAVSLARHP
jgi:hypothetical protein